MDSTWICQSMRLLFVATACSVVTATPASAALIETRSNYMGSDWSPSWSSEANWAAVTPYSAEPGDGLGGEINQISMAHDDTYLYVFFDEGSAFGFDAGNQNIYFDTDLNVSTGNTTDFWWWGQSMGGVGAEHTMYGWAIFHAADGAWTGDTVDASSSNSGNHLIQIARSKLGNPAAFNWTGRMFGVDDYYPNSGNWHQYSLVPESASAALFGFGLMLGWVFLVRGRCIGSSAACRCRPRSGRAGSTVGLRDCFKEIFSNH